MDALVFWAGIAITQAGARRQLRNAAQKIPPVHKWVCVFLHHMDKMERSTNYSPMSWIP